MKVFMSHIHEEEELTKTLAKWIRTCFGDAVHVFLSGEIPLGEEWLDTIVRELKSSDLVVAVCSPISLQRAWIHIETGSAHLIGVPIIPVCHCGQSPVGLPPILQKKQGIRMDDEAFVERFLNAFERHALTRTSDCDCEAMREELETTLGPRNKAMEKMGAMLSQIDELKAEAVRMIDDVQHMVGQLRIFGMQEDQKGDTSST